MKKIIISLMSLSVLFTVQGQDINNLVENPSFEELVGKIKRDGAITVANGWISPTKASADLFASKVKEADGYSTPLNNLGNEQPQDGSNYAGIRTFSYRDKEARSYISTKLKSTMKKGQQYCVTFYVNLGESSKYASNNIGINFSKKQYQIDADKSILTNTNTVMHKDNPVFNATFGWEQICGVYTAEGGEKFLTIGNFISNGETTNERLKAPKDFNGATVMSAYYFVDNVSVVMIDDESECKCRADERTVETKFVFSSAPISTEGLEPAQVAQFTTIYYGYGDTDIEPGNQGHLDNILNVMLKSKGKMLITSHLDKDEAKDPELVKLSEKRTEEIKLFLMKNGINYTRILTEDKKDTMPADNSGTDLARAKNRRVTFTYIP
jgi:outer membrane protein OmpA-like peptidoglycan-associated protein